MNKVIMQVWEESERGWGVRPDGCSLHMDITERRRFIDKVYESRVNSVVPDEYDRVIGDGVEVFVDDDLFSSVKKNGSIRIFEHELNNLIKFDELIIKEKI